MARTNALLVFVTILLISSACWGQVAGGNPVFGSLEGGTFDTVNLGNLNTHFSIPVLHKAGRGMLFTYDLSYDSSVWYPVGVSGNQTWTPVSNWGWRGVTEAAVGTLTNSSIVIGCDPGSGRFIYYFDYHDPAGTVHRFPMPNGAYNTCDDGPVTVPASDGSGYTLHVSTHIFSAVTTLYNRDGSIIDTAANTITDRNGNYLSSTISSNTTFTDTLGGTVLTVSGSGTPTSPMTYTYASPGTPSGVPVTVHYASKSVKTNFGCSGVGEYGPIAVSLVSDVTLPDGSAYSFTYEANPLDNTKTTGRLYRITLPTGGTITYTYTGGSNGITCADGTAAVVTRKLSPGGTWTYTRSGSGNSWTTIVGDPSSPSNETAINFSIDASATTPTNNFYETQRQVYQGSHTTGTLLMTTYNCWNNNFTSCATQSVSSPITKKDAYLQPPGVSCCAVSETYYDTYGRLTEDKEFNFGTVVVTDTFITYQNLGPILDKPSSVVVKDSASNVLAQTTYTYDEGTVTATSGTPQHSAVTGSRGNLTTLATQINSTQTLYRKFTYYDTGTVNTSTDVSLSSTTNGATTAYVYGSGTSCGNSFPTQINLPLSLSRSMTWNCTGGVQLTATDENNNSTATTYNDPYFWRPASATDQLNNTATMNYVNATTVERALPFNGTISTVDGRSKVDGLGRSIVGQRKQGPSASTYDSVETDYDVAGRVSRTTQAYAASVDTLCSGTCPGTTYAYDALNRPTTVTDAGGGTISFSYTKNDVLQTVGPAPTGEHTKQKQLEYDGLGRLTSVCEVTSGSGSGSCVQANGLTGYWTTYTYTPIGNLTGVTQNAQAAVGSRQTRSFAYDQLGRMISETNPENGTTTYVYDTDATCGTYAGDLVKRTDAVGNVTCYAYDGLHRVTSITYPSGSYSSTTPKKYFVYDATTVNGNSIFNGSGRLAEAYTCTGACSTKITDLWFSYSKRGEVTDAYEFTPHSGGTYHLTQSYWEHSALKTLSGLPGLPTITFGAADGSGLDGEGRVTKITASSGTNPLTGATYTLSGTSQPISSLTRLTFGSSDSDNYSYDPNTGRMTQYQFNVGSSGNGTPAFVQSTYAGQNANATSFSKAFTSNVAAGDLLFVTFANSTTNSISSVSDTLGNTYTALPLNTGNGYRLQAFYTFSIASGPDTVTGTYSGSGATFIQETLAEYSNVGALDVHAENSGGNSQPSTTTTTTASSDLVIGYVTDSYTTWTGETGWNLRTTGSGIRAALQDTISASPGSITSTFNTVNGWDAGIVAFKPGNDKGVLTWNANGTLQQLAITDPFSSANTQTCNFTYDDLARQSAANCGTAWNQTFSFDPFGNISKSATAGTIFNATYSSSTNRIATIGSLVPTYDTNGNLTNDTAHAYTWDAEGRMLTVDSGTSGGVCDTYDALGRMVEKATGASCATSYTEIVYSPSGGRLATMTGQTLQQASVPLIGGSEAVYNTSGLLAYRHSDHLGSSRFASTPSRTKYFDVAYAPYGEDYADSGTTDLSFTGQKKDTASWLYDFMFRKYNAAHGRWMSPDPAGRKAVNPQAPQTWNRYTYVSNNPISSLDRGGLLPIPACTYNGSCPGGGGWGPPEGGDTSEYDSFFDTRTGLDAALWGMENFDSRVGTGCDAYGCYGSASITQGDNSVTLDQLSNSQISALSATADYSGIPFGTGDPAQIIIGGFMFSFNMPNCCDSNGNLIFPSKPSTDTVIGNAWYLQVANSNGQPLEGTFLVTETVAQVSASQGANQQGTYTYTWQTNSTGGFVDNIAFSFNHVGDVSFQNVQTFSINSVPANSFNQFYAYGSRYGYSGGLQFANPARTVP